MMYMFIGLRHEITEICSINQKHRSNRTVTLNLCLEIHFENPGLRNASLDFVNTMFFYAFAAIILAIHFASRRFSCSRVFDPFLVLSKLRYVS